MLPLRITTHTGTGSATQTRGHTSPRLAVLAIFSFVIRRPVSGTSDRITAGPAVERKRPTVSRSLGCAMGSVSEANHSIRLRSLLALYDIELDFIAFLQRLVSVQLNRGVVNEYIWPVFASDESVALGVVKPLHFTFVLSHKFLPSYWGSLDIPGMLSSEGGFRTDIP